MGIRKALLSVAAVTALSLAACTPGSGGTGGSSPTTVVGGGASATLAAGSDRDGCLTGSWSVDVPDLGRQVAAKMQAVSATASGTGEGTILLIFGDSMTIKYDNSLIVTVPNPPVTMVFKETFTGDAASTDWSAKNGKLTGTMPAGGVQTKTEMTIGGQQVPPTMTPLGGSLDLGSAGLGYTCSGNSATLDSGVAVWKMTRAQ
jgi:hypothetical protein